MGTRFGILGTLEAHAAGAPVEIGAAQLRRLLCLLLLSAGRPVSQDSLVESLWPAEGAGATARPNDPHGTVRVYASRLRRLFPDVVHRHAGATGWLVDIEREALDATRFEALLAEGSAAMPTDAARAAAVLEEALSLFRGPTLLEFRDEPWAIAAAVRLDELHLACLERLGDVRLALGDQERLCGELEHLVKEHPVRERFWGQLMLALYRSGRQAEALRAYQRLREHLVDELGIEPSRELVELEAALLRQDPALDASRPGTAPLANAPAVTAPMPKPPQFEAPAALGREQARDNLPVELTSFIGREREVEELTALVEGFRLVTLTGPGGVGKTRLGLEVAGRFRERLAGGACLVELGALPREGDVELAVASALGVMLPTGSPAVTALAEALRTEELLLVLDNCEHLVDSCAALVGAVLRVSPRVRVLATSREPLGVDGEVIHRVASLGLPAEGETLLARIAAADAVRLFAERGVAQGSGFALQEANAAVIASVCRRLDGIPLALELAAARLSVLSPAQLHARLDERFGLLDSGVASRLPRHRTLEALIDWSYDLLGDAERSLLRTLAVFSGSFDLEAVEAVVRHSQPSADDVLAHLASLVDKSLVVVEPHGDVVRYRLLETVREYALGRIGLEPRADALAGLQDAHAATYLELAERAGRAVVTGEVFAWFDRFDLEADNYRTALAHLLRGPASGHDAMRMVVALHPYFECRGQEADLVAAAEALDEMGALADQPDPLVVEAVLIRTRTLGQSEPQRAIERLRRAHDVAVGLGDQSLRAQLLSRLAWLHYSTGQAVTASRFREEAVRAARASRDYTALVHALTTAGSSFTDRLEALELSRAVDSPLGAYMALVHLGMDALLAGDAASAKAYSEEALRIIERIRPAGLDPVLLSNLAWVRLFEGEHAAARPLFTRCLVTTEQHLADGSLGYTTLGFMSGYALLGLALCASSDGDHPLAAVLYGAVEGYCRRQGFTLELGAGGPIVQADEATLREVLGGPRFDALKDQGRSLSTSETVGLVLGQWAVGEVDQELVGPRAGSHSLT